MKIAFHTLGCKVNQYETQALREKFIARGHEIVADTEYADAYVINTCTVTGLSDRKSRQFIRRVKKLNPNSITAVIGCYAQVSPEEAASIVGVNIVAGTNQKNNILDYIENYSMDAGVDCHIKEWDSLSEYEETGVITAMDSRTRAFIKVQEGCNRFCSYCIIPYARGSVRSRDIEDIVSEAQNLINQGFKELVLTGINTALYGMEVERKADDELYGIEVIVNRINNLAGDFRIRIGSLEPNVIDGEYATRLMKYEKLCPHLHLSLQSGSNEIIKAMNRSYTVDGYLKIVENMRKIDPGFGITTDIIVGFPGESESDFEDSINVIKKAEFSKVHVFKYSKRNGTKAASMNGQVSSEIKSKRSETLIQIAEETSRFFFENNLGRSRTVLVEKMDRDTGLLEGYTDNYIKAFFEGSEVDLNTFVEVKLIELYQDGVKGKIIREWS